jgi:hypothetical protein
MADAAKSDWTYIRDEYYHPYHAVKVRYPELLKSDPRLQLAIASIDNAVAAIDAVMNEGVDNANSK